jgi:hypothetical protein
VATDRWSAEPERQCDHCPDALSKATRLVQLAAEHGQNGVISVEALAEKAYETAAADGESASVSGSAPWYGLDRELDQLQQLGLVEIDPGMASVVPPGSSAARTDGYAVVITQKANSLLGP